jgi:hypothetical protein
MEAFENSSKLLEKGILLATKPPADPAKRKK